MATTRPPSSPRSPSRAGRASARAPLTRERIETESLAMIEALGLDAFSTRKLGERLGCEAMSIYHHFPSKAHILDALVDRLLASLPIPSRGLSPVQRVRRLAQAWRAMSCRHPQFYMWMALHRWNSLTGVHFLSEVLACFHDAGLSDERAARGFRALGYYLLGATLDETRGYAQGPSAMEPITEDELLNQYPLVARAGRYFSSDQFDATFELGLDVMLRGLGLVPDGTDGSGD